MSTKVKNGNVPLSKYCWFWLAIFIPTISAFLMGVGIELSENFRSFLTNIWNMHKLPLAISSLSLPLTSWAIATHRSSVTQSMLEKQYNRQLLETFFDNERHFGSIYGSKIDNYGFRLIQKPDLPSIHSHIYEYNNLKTKGEISINKAISDNIEEFIGRVKDNLESFHIQDERSFGNRHVIFDASKEAIININKDFEKLSFHIGTPIPRIKESTIALYKIGFNEVIYLAKELGIVSKYFTEAINSTINSFDEANKTLRHTFGSTPESLTLEKIDSLNKELNKNDYLENNTPVIRRANEILLHAADELYRKRGLYIYMTPTAISHEGESDSYLTIVISVYQILKSKRKKIWLDKKNWNIKISSSSPMYDDEILVEDLFSEKVEDTVNKSLDSIVWL